MRIKRCQLLVIVSGWYVLAGSIPTHAAFRESELREYFQESRRKEYYSKCLSNPETYGATQKAYLQERGLLPKNEAGADDFIATVVRLETLLARRVYDGERIGKKDLDYLQVLYGNTNIAPYIRGRAGLLLYLETDKVDCLLTACRSSPMQVGIFASVYDDNFGQLLGVLLTQSFGEQVGELSAGLNPDGAEFSAIVGLNYVRLCMAIRKHQLSNGYLKWLFSNVTYFGRYSPFADPLHIARELRSFSSSYTTMFLASLMEGDEIDMLTRMAESDETLARMIVAIASEKGTKYAVIKEAALGASEKQRGANMKAP